MRAAGIGFALAALAGCDSILRLDTIHVVNPSPRALVFDNSASTTDLMNFPVLVALDSTKLDYARIGDPRVDLRFVGDDGSELPFEIETWDPTGESDLWVRVPLISAASSSDRILMYFGADAGGMEDPAGVWQGYDLVFHGGSFATSSGAFTPVPMTEQPTDPPPAFVDGVIGGGVRFTGVAGQQIDFANSGPLLDGWPTLAVELWVRPEYATTNLNCEEPQIIDKGPPLMNGRFFNAVPCQASPMLLQYDMALASGKTTFNNAYAPNGLWSYVVFTLDGQNLWTYRNGEFAAIDSAPAPTTIAADATDDVHLGGNNNRTPFAGSLDELRIGHGYETLDWSYAQYLSMSKHFVSFHDP